jgi:hypothetical protein
LLIKLPSLQASRLLQISTRSHRSQEFAATKHDIDAPHELEQDDQKEFDQVEPEFDEEDDRDCIFKPTYVNEITGEEKECNPAQPGPHPCGTAKMALVQCCLFAEI